MAPSDADLDSLGAGHPGFDLFVFDQGAYWADEAGTRYRIDLMSADERRELIHWLSRHAGHFYVQVLARELLAMLREAPGTLPPMTQESAEQWLRATPLVRALEHHSAGGAP
ncbi:hypothetical protein [Aeromicrobium sp. 9AM]|uniref:hypothetical protein n=1 Tax=Aeromicrobium sp. 9AM TaxID=2653126 RepID=UPI001F457A7E|nr:hypothetical protein [Aeromicrobium sp. 9AM]